MSMQDLKNLFEEKVRKPLRKRHRLPKPFRSNKRLKTGEDEDDWCDALNHLSVDSDSDEEFFDALEKQVTSKSLPTETERKMAQARKPSTNKYRYLAQSCTPSTSGLGSRTEYEVKIDQRQRQIFPRNLHSGDLQFGTKDSSTSPPMETEPYHVAAGGSNTATSSSSEAGVQVGFRRLTTIHDPPQEHPVKGYTGKGGISESELEKLAKDLMGDDYRSLGQKLGFSRPEVDRYCGYGKPKDSTGILRMLRAWKDKTPYAKQISGLLEALRKANLRHLADDLDLQEAPSTSTTKKIEPFRFGYGQSNTAPSSSSESDVQVRPKQSATSDDPSQSQLPMEDYTDKGGISESKLEKLAKDLMGDDYRSLGRKLGFIPKEVYQYCGYGKPKDSTGILRMLRVWKRKTPDAKQISGLLEALKKANLRHLADDLDLQEGKLEKRKVTVTLMTSWHLSSIEGFKKKLMTLQRDRHDLIEAVKVLVLPFSGLKRYAFTEVVDIMVLCHSIENRRFGITNVTDSLYDEFLDYCNKKLGKERIAVIAHDFEEEAVEVRAVRMETFKHTQSSTFEKAGLVMICGMMDKTPEIQEKDWNSLVFFLENASKSTPTIADISLTTLPKINTSDTKQKLNKSEKVMNIFGTTSSSGPVGMVTRSNKPVIYICTSWGLYSIRGLKEKLKTLLKQLFSRYEIKEQDLPYSCLEDFKFPPEVDRTDAMILCHSVQNRGFSITDVDNSIYDEFLKYCNRVFGKGHMAVIVHDFDNKPEILKVHLGTILRSQPATYTLAGFVAVAGQLDVPDVQLSHDKSTSLEMFVRGLR